MAKRYILKVGADKRNPIRGNSLRLTISPLINVPLGTGGIQKAWITFKNDIDDSDAESLLQKVITDVAALSGYISESGAVSTRASFYFDLSPDDTLLFPANKRITYDIKCQTGGGIEHTPVVGEVTFNEWVTRAPEE